VLVYYVVGLAVVAVLALDQLIRRRSVIYSAEYSTRFASVTTAAPTPERRPGPRPRPRSLKAASGFAFVVVGAILVAFSGLRYGIGTDYHLYVALYSQISPASLVASLEQVPQDIGYVALSFVLKKLGYDAYALFWASALLAVVPLMVALYRMSGNPAASLFVYYFLGLHVLSFNAIRQSIAVAFLLLADTYREESRSKWLLFSAIAAFFHISALVVFVIQFLLSFWKPTPLTVVAVLTLSGLIATVLLQTEIVNEIAGSLNERYQEHLAANEGAGIGTSLTLLLRLVIIIMIIRFISTKTERRYLAFVVGSAAVLVLALSNSLMGRFDSYFSIYLVFLVPMVLGKERVKGWYKALIYGALFVYFGFYVSNYNDVNPYVLLPELGGG